MAMAAYRALVGEEVRQRGGERGLASVGRGAEQHEARPRLDEALVEHRLASVGLEELGGVTLLELTRREEGRVLAQALAHRELDLGWAR
eukprot:scaffold71583_cov54-Phaeocystis_antarctica.AAC.2